jgi:RNA polymerase sigma factor (TIGR02999 family)
MSPAPVAVRYGGIPGRDRLRGDRREGAMETEKRYDEERSAQALFSYLYERLKAMAGQQRARAGSPASLSTTEVVHELYLRMSGDRELRFAHEFEFFSYASRAMRHVLVDLARRRMSLKEGGDLIRIEMQDADVGALAFDSARLLDLDAALRELEAEAPRAAKVLELHYFGGLPLDRVSELTGTAPRTVDRDWRYARSFIAVRVQA